MANHKSALKRNRQSLVRRERNRMNRSKVKTAIKKVDTAITVDDSVIIHLNSGAYEDLGTSVDIRVRLFFDVPAS